VAFHTLSEPVAEEIAQEETTSSAVQQILKQAVKPENLPELVPRERRQMITEIARYIRNFRFAQAIRAVYDRCAICGFQYDEILDAAHIIPVAESGTDTYDNGLGLCPRCHRMFDKGFVLVDEAGKIYINPRYAEEYDQIGKAGSLQTLRETLREHIWQPEGEAQRPSPANLRRTFQARR
jgi:predicted restriction endonuclease